MTDVELEAKLAQARRVEPSAALARPQQIVWGVRGRLLSQRKRRILGGSLLAAVVVIGLGVAGAHSLVGSGTEAPRAAATRRDDTEHWSLRDGSRIVIETANTVIKKRLESATALEFELERGAAKFEVTPRPERAFKVHGGDVTVTVTGTRFRVERSDTRVTVAVTEGSVLVSWPGGAETLRRGASGVFPPSSARPVAVAPVNAPAAMAETAAAKAQSTETERPPTSEALFAEADAARASGRHADALAKLETLTQRYPRDPRAPLAAFTRGRLLLENLRRPAHAAVAFAQARSMTGPKTALAEDALAREVEAHRAAGTSALARERAELYTRLYPAGLRLRQVRAAGGLPLDP
jgi:transmembrane sensor